MTVRVTVDKQAALESIIKKMTEKSVYVGIRGGRKRMSLQEWQALSGHGSKVRKQAKASPKEEPTNEEIAYINEFGSHAMGIPPRPFLMPAVRSKKAEIARIFEKNLKVALRDFNPEHIDNTLEAVGSYVRQTAKLNITNSVNMLPLSELTLELRREEGFPGTKPLRVTGQLVGSIDYVVE